jgi:hypothetical protein
MAGAKGDPQEKERVNLNLTANLRQSGRFILEYAVQARHKYRTSIGQVAGQVAGQVLRPRKAGEIQKLVGLRHREIFQNNYLKPLLEAGWLERTIPDKPRSRKQRYRTTALGLKVLRRKKRKS